MSSVRLKGIAELIKVGKIVCVGANYGRHVKEMGRKEGEPMLFFKPPNALVPDGGLIPYPDFSKLLHHELEMVLLVGKGGARIDPGKAREHLAGVGVGLDLTARDRQQEDMQRGHPWAVSKGFDASAPVSEFVPMREGLNPDDRIMILKVNGEVRQQASTSEMILSTGELIALISRYFTLEPGDLIFTGTPEGVGPLEPGDELEIELAGLTIARFSIVSPRRSGGEV